MLNGILCVGRGDAQAVLRYGANRPPLVSERPKLCTHRGLNSLQHQGWMDTLKKPPGKEMHLHQLTRTLRMNPVAIQGQCGRSRMKNPMSLRHLSFVQCCSCSSFRLSASNSCTTAGEGWWHTCWMLQLSKGWSHCSSHTRQPCTVHKMSGQVLWRPKWGRRLKIEIHVWELQLS